MFEEAEKFAITFELDLEVSEKCKSTIYWNPSNMIDISQEILEHKCTI